MNSEYLNAAAYRFFQMPEEELGPKAAELKELCQSLEILGSITLSPEGINIMLAGTPANFELYQQKSQEILPQLKGLEYKISYSDRRPFRRIYVKIKKEIITLGLNGIEPLKEEGPRILAKDLKSWLDEGKDFTLLDTRNDYEYRMGSFDKAELLPMQVFSEFPERLKDLPVEAKEKPLVMFCTGGIRCERASLVALKQGFKEVYQLEGGILKYFEEVGGEHYRGECFVFDGRVGVGPDLKETESVLCFACGEPLSLDDQRAREYVFAKSCPYCLGETPTKKPSVKDLAEGSAASGAESVGS